MKKPFVLSDTIRTSETMHEGQIKHLILEFDYIWSSDVKEFIKLLKEKSDIDGDIHISEDELNKLAGDKLL